jgi:hypothetical protein
MAIVVGLVLALSVVATGYQLFQLVACRAFFRRARRRAARVKDYRPPVTILKPLKGRGIDLYANLASFCRQDYPEYQIVCGVADPNDPAVDVVRKIQRDFPHRDVVLSIGDRPGVNRKVANLRHMMEHAKHAVLALSDADVRVRPDYLRRSVAPLASEKVGLTTCLYRGRGFFGLPSVIESILINCDFVPLVLTAQFIGQRNALGASLVFKREPFERMGGFPRIADHLADDNLLGELVKEAGLTVETLLRRRDDPRLDDAPRRVAPPATLGADLSAAAARGLVRVRRDACGALGARRAGRHARLDRRSRVLHRGARGATRNAPPDHAHAARAGHAAAPVDGPAEGPRLHRRLARVVARPRRRVERTDPTDPARRADGAGRRHGERIACRRSVRCGRGPAGRNARGVAVDRSS